MLRPIGVVSLVLFSISISVAHAGDNSRAPWVGKQLDGKKCENNANVPGDGPYNYRDRPAIDGTLNMVNNAHFPEKVENLEGGSTGTLMGDMDFTLRAFPNHHRALNSSVKYSLRFKRWPDSEHGLPAECYLQRAMKFDPNDSVPFELYGYYMHLKGKDKEALEAYKKARKIRPNDILLAYNTALIMTDQEQWQDAVEIARPLYDAGLSLPGLKRKLIKAGKWQYSAEEKAALKAIKTAKDEEKAAKAEESANRRANLKAIQAAKAQQEAEASDQAPAQAEDIDNAISAEEASDSEATGALTTSAAEEAAESEAAEALAASSAEDTTVESAQQ